MPESAALTAIGECMIELSGSRGDLWRMGFAGDTFNTAYYAHIALARLGSGPADGAERRVAYATLVGDDPFSERMLAFFAESGIATDRIRRLPGRRPGLYAITLQGAERSFTYWRGESAARALADDPEWLDEALSASRMLYLSGITLAILGEGGRETLLAALARRRAEGAVPAVAFDPNYRPALWEDAATARRWVERAYAEADIVLPGRDDERALFGDAGVEEIAARVARLGPGEVVVKNGDRDGALRAGGETALLPPERIPDPVDTTGAGDSFNGAYLAARLAGRPPAAAARLGHAVSATVIRHHGALVDSGHLESVLVS
jgi:2-dehydro-3-deoxygluconokinase